MSRRLEESVRRLENKIKKLTVEVGSGDERALDEDLLTKTDSHSGDLVIIGTSTGASVVKGNLVYLNSSRQWNRAAAGDGANAGDKHLIGIAVSTTPHSDGVLATGLYSLNTSLVSGSISAAGNFDVGQQVFMHPHTSGSYTTLIPSGSGETVRVIGHAVNTSVIFFNPSGDFIEV